MFGNYQESIKEVQEYVKLEFEYHKATFVEKMTILISALLITLVIGILCFCAFFYLTYAFAAFLSEIVASAALAYTIIAGIYLLLVLVVIVLKKSLIINPLSKFITKLFINP